MIDPSELKRELNKVRDIANGNIKEKGEVLTKEQRLKKAQNVFAQLQNFVMDDISKTGDQRVRQLMRMIKEFQL